MGVSLQWVKEMAVRESSLFAEQVYPVNRVGCVYCKFRYSEIVFELIRLQIVVRALVAVFLSTLSSLLYST
jgi:hypothetical protein